MSNIGFNRYLNTSIRSVIQQAKWMAPNTNKITHRVLRKNMYLTILNIKTYTK